MDYCGDSFECEECYREVKYEDIMYNDDLIINYKNLKKYIANKPELNKKHIIQTIIRLLKKPEEMAYSTEEQNFIINRVKMLN